MGAGVAVIARLQAQAMRASRANLNLTCPLPSGGGGEALLRPVHLAAAGGSLPMLRWLAAELRCPLRGPLAMTVGKPSKGVMRIAIECASVDVLQWLVSADDEPPHVGLPMPVPLDSGCAPAAVHRALEAALRDGWRHRALLNHALDQAAETSRASSEADPPPLGLPADQPRGEGGRTYPSLYPQGLHEQVDEATECVVCLAAPRECVLVSCGHQCVCEQCSGALGVCPLCRAPVERAIRVYQ